MDNKTSELVLETVNKTIKAIISINGRIDILKNRLNVIEKHIHLSDERTELIMKYLKLK